MPVHSLPFRKTLVEVHTSKTSSRLWPASDEEAARRGKNHHARECPNIVACGYIPLLGVRANHVDKSGNPLACNMGSAECLTTFQCWCLDRQWNVNITLQEIVVGRREG